MPYYNEICHDGIPGMKWGHRNGPPYPLSYKNMSADEKAAAKAVAIRKGNAKEAANNIDEFTDQELRSIKERYFLNSEIKKLSVKDIEDDKAARRQKIDDLERNLERIVKITNSGIAIYNNTAKVINGVNSFNGSDQKPLPLLAGGGGDGGKNKAKGSKK